jgi:maltose O-acetyltransferase
MGISQEEEKIFKGEWFSPGHPGLTAMKKKAHALNMRYNASFEDETEERSRILAELLGKMGKDCRIQGPVFFHYGCHTAVGDRFFANFNLTVQDDAKVTIGDDCNFGPGVMIVTPVHPMLTDEKRLLKDRDGAMKHLCMAKPVTIGNDLSSAPG